ncbi:hypothetical protein MJG53_000819 [Ovis ammon polii x Ovis aries]|uniref:Uncharacterized protein n=1 Tax=Ovis ammon polii x Ovis aries TaxID=2918886 RepID=A0ACB9VK69_9CETA|nr:hypothetical protein MJT46_000310 [Ovis ammon polii x Ovis aries]KAI4589770.1 hypothetical protein MJG53_000819 [Ovis ammon polii x Ovis aries]
MCWTAARGPQSMEGCGVESSYATQGTLDKPASDHLGLSLTVRQVNQKKEYKFDLVFTTEFYRAEKGVSCLSTLSTRRDSHGYIAPSLRPIWNLAFLGSSYVMWQKTTPFLHYFMSQISSVKQWKTNDDAIDFDYTVLLHEFSTQEIIPCRIHLVWYPGKPLKVKYHCQERQTPEEGSGTEEGSAVALTELSNF